MNCSFATAFALVAVVLAGGCQDRSVGTAAGASASGSAASVPSSSSATSSSRMSATAGSPSAGAPDAGRLAATLPKVATRSIVGVGAVPIWASERGATAPCKPSVVAQGRLDALAKGEDAALSDGTLDLAALLSDVTDGCPAAARALARALSDGGSALLSAKKYPQADRWLAAALSVRPALASARHALARSLALEGKHDDAVWAIGELARGVKDVDPASTAALERARTDEALKSVRDDPAFVAAMASAPPATLLAPERLDPATASAAMKLLGNEFVLGSGGTTGMRHFQPTVVELWTWRPEDKVALVVATFAHDPTPAARISGDPLAGDYGGLAVYRRDGGKLQLLLAQKAGATPPLIAPGKNGTLVYELDDPCGPLRGALVWKAGAINAVEQQCRDL